MSEHGPPTGPDDAASTVRLPTGSIKISRSGVGITLQTGTLVALLGIGWEAKGALEENFERLDTIEMRFEQKTDAIEKAMGQLEIKVASAQVSAEQLVQLQLANADLRGELTAALQRIAALERTVDRDERRTP